MDPTEPKRWLICGRALQGWRVARAFAGPMAGPETGGARLRRCRDGVGGKLVPEPRVRPPRHHARQGESRMIRACAHRTFREHSHAPRARPLEYWGAFGMAVRYDPEIFVEPEGD